ncbi:MAG: hypothetical protein ABIS50_18895 [Luteolibacter sp.]|uniref:hypothetical protein n=1 Tax=Luteolibacter sp. TaxID=1962973 RepID=UPI0032642C42
MITAFVARTARCAGSGLLPTSRSTRRISPSRLRISTAGSPGGAFIPQGVDVTSHEPNYYYTRLGELKLEMLAEAAKDARARAENILNSAGNTGVGKLVYADMGTININAANSTETSNEGNNDTSSRDKDIITIIHAEFEVN